MPTFQIAAGANVTADFQFEYKGKVYEEDGKYRFPLDIVFLYGTKDIYRKWFVAHELYSMEKLIIWYEQGHTFPRALKHEDFERISGFLMQKYKTKFPSASSQLPQLTQF